jgi:hypothetical protein
MPAVLHPVSLESAGLAQAVVLSVKFAARSPIGAGQKCPDHGDINSYSTGGCSFLLFFLRIDAAIVRRR